MNTDLFQETIRCLKPDPKCEGVFLLIEPHLLYLSDEQADVYLEVMETEEYTASFHGPTVEIIKSNLPAIFSDIEEGVSLIDMGPGYPDKSLPMVQYLKVRGIPCRYVPVDVSRPFLDLAARHVEPFVEWVYPVHAIFETCADRIPAEVYQYTTYCMIGLTFMNFPPEILVPLLQDIAGGDGRVVVASELLSDTKTEDLVLAAYRTEAARAFGFGPLRHLGFREGELAYQPVFANGRVELHYRLEQAPGDALQALGVRAGHTIVTAVSYRYTENQLRELLRRYFKSQRVFTSPDGGTAVAIGWD
ncbi:MAG: L-histidine N(alpha)-methyltransferase [Chloroflexi bacterium]|nr:L-histidine N(alpha)-methyltransferase [Chloroflexota bacterium]MBU1752232.1 L-histidine N(alpha)-methyltransferase [Chloroflexota bacterium]MBU1879380.1 L-histidine N(alpha)-methyltransferase [Chloroflexota bacterium]